MHHQDQHTGHSNTGYHLTEESRVNELRNYRILDTFPEKEFDSITKIISHICNAPISLITFIDKDRQWFKSAKGVGELAETPNNISFCQHTIMEDADYMMVDDLTKDERFVDNPFVLGEPHVKFYAGVSLKTKTGHKLGSVCVLDNKPRHLTAAQFECLNLMSEYTMRLLELRKQNQEFAATQKSLKDINQNLEQFAYALAHDIKAPLRIMSGFTSFLLRDTRPKLDKKEQEYLQFIVNSAKELSTYTQNLLRFSQSTQLNTDNCGEVDLDELLRSVNSLLNQQNNITFLYNEDLPTIFTSEIGLKQVLQNLISNSIRYRNRALLTSYVSIEFDSTPTHYEFKVIDNGNGISDVQKEVIFELFKRNKLNTESTGIGLNVVKRLVEKMNGSILVESIEGKGTTVTFTIERIMKIL